MTENKDLEQLKNDVKLFTEEVLPSILVVLAHFKKTTEQMGEETKTLVSNILSDVENKHKDVLEKLGGSSEQTKSDILEEFAGYIDEVKQLFEEVKQSNAEKTDAIDILSSDLDSFKIDTKAELEKLLKKIEAVDSKKVETLEKEEIIKEVLSQIPTPQYEKVILDTPEQIVGKINSLPEKEEFQIDFKHIKNVPVFKDNKMLVGGRIFAQMADVSFSNLQNGDFVVWDATNLRFKNIPSSGVGGVTSVFGRTGAVVAVSGDYTTAQVTESGNLYFTNARAIASTLTGYVSGAGTITSSDTILSAIQKLNGNIAALPTPVTSVSGTTNRITSTGGATPVIDIAATYVGQASITTLGTIGTGTWQGTAIAPAYMTVMTSTVGGAVPTPPNDATKYLDGTGNFSVPAGSGGLSTTKSVTQSSHGFTVGQVLKFTGGLYALAKADSAANAEVVGIVSAVGSVNTFTLLMEGYISGLSGLTGSTTYFLSPTVAGGLTTTEPSTVGQVSKPLLNTDSTISGIFNNMRGSVITAPLSLTSAHIFVGNSSNLPVDVSMSGDITIDNTGATTIGANKVTYDKLDTEGEMGLIAAMRFLSGN